MPRSESPIVVPQPRKVQLDKAEVVVLRAHIEDWKSVKGKERSRVLLAIHKEASLQAPTKEKAILKARKKIYKQWLQNQSRRKQAPKALIKYGRRWTARQVLIHTHKALIREETGEMAGSEAMIGKWPVAAKTVINCLPAEEREEAEAMAERWNNEAVPPDIQAEVAETKGADMIEHFATEMFKTAGMRVCVLSAWKDGNGKLMLGGHDFNEQFANGESFIKTRDWDGIIMPEWVEYSGEQFYSNDGDKPQMVRSKKRVQRMLIQLEEDADGWPILPDAKEWKCAEQQHLIRSFLTKLYRICIGEDNVKAAVPWGDVIHNQLAFFDSTQWPADIQFKELSKMDKADAAAVLDFWFTRQENNCQPAFSFKAWKDSDGEMEEAVLCPLTTHHGKASKQAKGKGKSNTKRKCNRHMAVDNDAEEESDGDMPLTSDDEKASSANRGQEASPPQQVALPPAKSGKVKSQPARSRRDAKQVMGNIIEVVNAPTTSRHPGRGTRSKRVTHASNDAPKSLKHHAADPVSDTPAKCTRSKAAAPEGPKAKHSRK